MQKIRKGPEESAKDFPGEKKKGLNGKMWISRKMQNGTYRWFQFSIDANNVFDVFHKYSSCETSKCSDEKERYLNRVHEDGKKIQSKETISEDYIKSLQDKRKDIADAYSACSFTKCRAEVNSVIDENLKFTKKQCQQQKKHPQEWVGLVDGCAEYTKYKDIKKRKNKSIDDYGTLVRKK